MYIDEAWENNASRQVEVGFTQLGQWTYIGDTPCVIEFEPVITTNLAIYHHSIGRY
jgi:hypothetical protein